MKRTNLIKTMCCLLTLTAAASFAQAQSAPPQSDEANLAELVRQLSAEVKTLKRELAALQLESQQGKVTRLERELKQVRRESQQMEQAEKEFYDEMARLEAQLSQSATPDEQADLNAERSALSSQSPEKTMAMRRQFAERESELSERLQQEQERLQKLLKMIKQ